MGKVKQVNENLKKKYLGEMANLKPELTGIKGVTLFCSPEMGLILLGLKFIMLLKIFVGICQT